jgi:multidrug efflux system membrane fusion protein
MMHQICGVLFVSALLWGCSNDSAPTTKTKPAVPVTTTTAKVSNFPVKRTYPAVASSVWKVEIIARVEGWLEARPAPQGSRVEAGDLLFVIQQEPYEASLLVAQADLAEAEAQEMLAQIIVDRNAPLVGTGAISAEEFDQYEANNAIAKAAVLAAEAQIVLAELNLSYTEIRAPIAGRVGATSIDPGTYVVPGTDAAVLCTLITANPIRINFAPSANEFPEFLKNWKADQLLQADVKIPRVSGWKRTGKITFVDNAANPDTSLIRMWTDIDNAGYSLLPGQYCQATVTMSILKDSITIPTTALVQQASDQYVWLVESDDTVTQTKVEVALSQDGTAVLNSGLKAGDRIVTSGFVRIRNNGTKIKEAPPAAPPGTPPPSPDSSSSKKKTD